MHSHRHPSFELLERSIEGGCIEILETCFLSAIKLTGNRGRASKTGFETFVFLSMHIHRTRIGNYYNSTRQPAIKRRTFGFLYAIYNPSWKFIASHDRKEFRARILQRDFRKRAPYFSRNFYQIYLSSRK